MKYLKNRFEFEAVLTDENRKEKEESEEEKFRSLEVKEIPTFYADSQTDKHSQSIFEVSNGGHSLNLPLNQTGID